jgi:gamma-glutamyltranspeptidase / glutathione hydrolase
MRYLRTTIAVLFVTVSLAGRAASVASVGAAQGMVVTAQHQATKVGVDILRQGGNAIDAAVAVGYTLAVVYPAAGNLGGGGFMTIHFADGRNTFLDFREKAPLAARSDMYLDDGGNVVNGASTRGHLAVAVPGTVSSLERARRQYGTMKSWRTGRWSRRCRWDREAKDFSLPNL